MSNRLQFPYHLLSRTWLRHVGTYELKIVRLRLARVLYPFIIRRLRPGRVLSVYAPDGLHDGLLLRSLCRPVVLFFSFSVQFHTSKMNIGDIV